MSEPREKQLEDRLNACLDVLEDVEFVDTSDSEYRLKCPFCLAPMSQKREHRAGCKLAAVLGR